MHMSEHENPPTYPEETGILGVDFTHYPGDYSSDTNDFDSDFRKSLRSSLRFEEHIVGMANFMRHNQSLAELPAGSVFAPN